MSNSLPLRTALIFCTVLCVGLTTATVVQTSRVSHLRADLEEAQINKPARSQSNSAAVSDTALQQLLADKEAEYADLQKQYDELQRSVAQASERSAELRRASNTNSVPNRRQDAGGGRRGQGGAAWLEQLRKNDPERYQQIVTQREQRRQQAEQEFQDQLAVLDQRAQTAATPVEADLATQIADTLTKLNDLRTQMQAARNLPEDDPQRQALIDQLAQQIRPLTQEMGKLRDQDRINQWTDILKGNGITDPNTLQSAVNDIKGVLDKTRYNYGGGGFGGGRPPASSQPSQPSTPTTSK